MTACALVGAAVFPVLGNALALLMGIPRRAAQAFVLVIFAGLAIYGWWRLYDHRILVWGTIGRRHLSVVLVSIVLVGGLSLRGVVTGTQPSLYAIYSAMVVPLWLSLATLNLVAWRRNSEPGQGFRPSKGFSGFVCTLLAVLTLMAYFKGPDEGDVLMAFGGSSTLVGSTAAILGGIAFSTLKGWSRPVGLSLAIYLCFLATSRTGWILFVLLLVIILAVRSADLREACASQKWLILDVGIIVMCASIVLVPVRFSQFYPYFSSRPGEAGARLVWKLYTPGARTTRTLWLTEVEAFQVRYARFLRPLLFAQFIQRQFMRMYPAQLAKTLEEDAFATVTGQSTMQLSTLMSGDSRWALLLDSMSAVRSNPWGHWPQPFAEATRIWCGEPLICEYPHNLLLEVGFHFGWIPLGLLAIGLLACVIRVVKSLAHHTNLVRVAAITFFGYLVLAQLSGNLLDHSMTLAFGVFWMSTQAFPKSPLSRDALAFST